MPITFITGATSGFGKAAAEKFAANGHALIINGRREDRLLALSNNLQEQYQVAVLPLVFDVRDQQAVFNAVQGLSAQWQQIDILVNNAGLAAGRDYFNEADLGDWNTMVDTNIKGFMYVAQAVSKLMVPLKKGHIINIGSIAGKQVYEKGNVYCATKHAVDALNQAMRIDLLRHNIRVTAIHPGAAETEFSLVRLKGDAKAASEVYTGMKALSAEDIAETIYWTTTLPPHVCVNDMIVTCVQQADAFYYNRK